MHRRHYVFRQRRFLEFAPVLSYAKLLAEQRLGGGGAKADHSAGLYHGNLGVEPRQTRADFDGIGLGMDAALAARLPLEVFHQVGDISYTPIDSCFLERPIEQFAGATDERLASEVFVITGLLAHKHHLSFHRAFAENRLCAAFPQIETLA